MTARILQVGPMRIVGYSNAEVRAELETIMGQLAGAIERGECAPNPVELAVLAALCDVNDLPEEADRLRFWAKPPAGLPS